MILQQRMEALESVEVLVICYGKIGSANLLYFWWKRHMVVNLISTQVVVEQTIHPDAKMITVGDRWL